MYKHGIVTAHVQVVWNSVTATAVFIFINWLHVVQEQQSDVWSYISATTFFLLYASATSLSKKLYWSVCAKCEVSVQRCVVPSCVMGQWNITSTWSCSIWQHIVWNDICMTAWWYLSTNCKRHYPNTREKCFIANIFQNIDINKKLISELLPFAGDWTVSLGRIGLFSCL